MAALNPRHRPRQASRGNTTSTGSAPTLAEACRTNLASGSGRASTGNGCHSGMPSASGGVHGSVLAAHFLIISPSARGSSVPSIRRPYHVSWASRSAISPPSGNPGIWSASRTMRMLRAPASWQRAATVSAYSYPAMSWSGRMMTSRSRRGAHDVFSAALAPPALVVASSPHRMAASAAFSPSTITTGLYRLADSISGNR